MSLVEAVKEMGQNIQCTPYVKRLLHFTVAIFEKRTAVIGRRIS